MEYKLHPKEEASIKVRPLCGGNSVGVRNMVFSALLEASKTDFKNGGDRRNFGSAEKAMWGMIDWEVDREEIVKEVAQAVYCATYGHYGAFAKLPKGCPPMNISFGANVSQSETYELVQERDYLRDILEKLGKAMSSVLAMVEDEGVM